MTKALIAMSGGVDSAVSALLTKEKGWDCIGCNMRLYDNFEDADFEGFASPDARDAANIAAKLGMSFVYEDLRDKFRSTVMQNFADEYFAGHTPNPCVVCNKHLKFGALMNKAKELACDYIVTGHYAQIEDNDGQFYLKKAKDQSKDQTYVLYQLTQELLAHVYFPLGTYTKDEARDLAEKNGFEIARKKDSQDICFVPDGEYVKLVESISGRTSEPGDFKLSDGTLIGCHKGIINYTIGQRKGLGIAYEHPLYVCRICPEENCVYLSDNDELFTSSAELKNVNWISGNVPEKPAECTVKVRYKAKEVEAVITAFEDSCAHVEFKTPQRAVTSGQSAVFYDGEYCIGGGIIL